MVLKAVMEILMYCQQYLFGMKNDWRETYAGAVAGLSKLPSPLWTKGSLTGAPDGQNKTFLLKVICTGIFGTGKETPTDPF